MTQDVAARLKALSGTPFMKMTGSGNDFVVFDGRAVNGAALIQPEVIAAICNRHNGIGADGLVLLEPSISDDGGPAAVRLRYFNRDGTLGELCGNATLCSTRFAILHGLAGRGSSDGRAVMLDTDSGRVRARLVNDTPEIDLAPVTEVIVALDGVSTSPAVSRIGYARVGVPHVVLLTASLDAVDVVGEGRPIRQHQRLSPDGANVNWLAPLADGRWSYRTYERGVEDETLACGTGAIACAILLTEWGIAEAPVELVTRSGRSVTVSFRPDPAASANSADAAGSSDGSAKGTPEGVIGERARRALHDATAASVTLLPTDAPAQPRADGAADRSVVHASGSAIATESKRPSTPDATPNRQWHASLRGEGRVVFRGTIAALD